jgi:hypothetical protein
MNRLRAPFYALASHRLWWLAFGAAAAVFALIQSTVEAPLSLLLSLPVVVFGFMVSNERSRWKRDEAREKHTGIRRGPFD